MQELIDQIVGAGGGKINLTLNPPPTPVGGAPGSPGGQPAPGGAPGNNPLAGLAGQQASLQGGGGGAPPGIPGQGGMDPQTQELLMTADQIFQQQTGQSFLQLMEATQGQPPPEAVQAFEQILAQLTQGGTTGPQEAGVGIPAGLI